MVAVVVESPGVVEMRKMRKLVLYNENFDSNSRFEFKTWRSASMPLAVT